MICVHTGVGIGPERRRSVGAVGRCSCPGTAVGLPGHLVPDLDLLGRTGLSVKCLIVLCCCSVGFDWRTVGGVCRALDMLPAESFVLWWIGLLPDVLVLLRS